MKKFKDEKILKNKVVEVEETYERDVPSSFSDQTVIEEQTKEQEIVDDNKTVEQISIEEHQKEVPLSEEEKKLLKENQETVANSKSRKKKITSMISMIINIGIVIAILLVQIYGTDESVMSLGELFNSGINWWCITACLVLFLIVNITNGMRLQLVIKDTTKKNMPLLAYKVAAIGRYYDDITPLGSGGQPFQIYYLSKRGFDGGSALSVPLGNYVVQMSVMVIVSLCVMISSVATVSIDSTSKIVVSAASWIGVSANLALIGSIIFLSVNRKVGTKIIVGILKFLQKIKIIKNYEKQYNKVIKFIDDYQTAMKRYMKSKWTFIGMILLTLFNMICHYSIPFMIYSAFSGVIDFSLWWGIVVKCIMIDMAMTFIPLPGGSGAVELSFAALFSSMFTDGRLFWALIFWRILSFYGYIIQGIIIQIYDFVWGNKKFEWLQKKWSLEAESEKFKNQQIEQFESSLIERKQVQEVNKSKKQKK